MKKLTTIAIGSAIAMLFIGTLYAKERNRGENKGEGKQGFSGSEEMKAYRNKQKEVQKEYKENKKEENKAFHETLKDVSPNEALTAIIAHRKTQYSETQTFMTKLYNEFVTNAKEIMAKNEVPDEKQAELLKKFEAHRNKGLAKHKERHDKLITALEALKGNEDLTMEQIKKTFSEIHPRRNRKSGKGDKKGNRKNRTSK